jgi:hypothetical protein
LYRCIINASGISPCSLPRALREGSWTLLGRVTEQRCHRIRRRKLGATRPEACGGETRCGKRKRVAATVGSPRPVADRDPGRPAEAPHGACAKSVGGADGKPSATQRRSRPRARKTPGEQRADGRLTPALPPRTPAGSKALKPGRSGPGCGTWCHADRPDGQRQEGIGRREAPRLRGRGKLRRGQPHERYRP